MKRRQLLRLGAFAPLASKVIAALPVVPSTSYIFHTYMGFTGGDMPWQDVTAEEAREYGRRWAEDQGEPIE